MPAFFLSNRNQSFSKMLFFLKQIIHIIDVSVAPELKDLIQIDGINILLILCISHFYTFSFQWSLYINSTRCWRLFIKSRICRGLLTVIVSCGIDCRDVFICHCIWCGTGIFNFMKQVLMPLLSWCFKPLRLGFVRATFGLHIIWELTLK